MIRKVRYSLRIKFIIAITVLLLVTMSFYLTYALGIFQSDKAADIYSTTLSNSIGLADKMNLLLSEETKIDEILKDSSESFNIKKDAVFKAYPSILAIECIENENYISFLNFAKLQDQGIANDFELMPKSTEILASLNLSQWNLFSDSNLNLPNYYTIGKKISDAKKCLIHISIDKLMTSLEDNSKYGSYLITDTGKLFLNFTKQKINSSEILKIIKEPTIINNNYGTKKFNDNEVSMIRSFAKINDFNLIAISEINERTAFLASELLINKSIIYGVLLLSLAVIVGIIFTRRLTTGLQMLFEATQELSRGNFDINPIIKGNDEIASLTDSFVDMKNKILKFMEEMKEKTRIENEIQIAKLVQDSFFPRSYISGNGFNVFGLYRPATECSGDWWGILEQGNKLTVIVCDATGHGVGAALVTAAAHSSLSSLKIEAANNYISPKMILNRLNRVICDMNSQIMMTGFVLEINRDENKIIYSNASHVPPLLLQFIDDQYSKDHINPLIENNSSRLGENLHTIYTESELSISVDDKILLFSDGIVEANNGEKNYGQRNFIKSYVANATHPVEIMIQKLMTDLEIFQNGHVPDDDITLIGIEIGKSIPLIKSLDNFSSIRNTSNSFISELENKLNVEEIISSNQVHHLIGVNSKNIIKEFNFLNKLKRSNSFNFKKYFKSARNFYKRELVFNKTINAEINLFVENCRPFFEFALKPAQVELVLDELLSNAFYHSKHGQNINRGDEVILLPGEKISLDYFYDDEYLVISVIGPGSFKDISIITNSLNRARKEMTPIEGQFGAGLGLYLVYDNVSQFWVLNSPGKSSEIICVFEKFNRNKQLKERITSFHYIELEIENE